MFTSHFTKMSETFRMLAFPKLQLPIIQLPNYPIIQLSSFLSPPLWKNLYQTTLTVCPFSVAIELGVVWQPCSSPDCPRIPHRPRYIPLALEPSHVRRSGAITPRRSLPTACGGAMHPSDFRTDFCLLLEGRDITRKCSTEM